MIEKASQLRPPTWQVAVQAADRDIGIALAAWTPRRRPFLRLNLHPTGSYFSTPRGSACTSVSSRSRSRSRSRFSTIDWDMVVRLRILATGAPGLMSCKYMMTAARVDGGVGAHQIKGPVLIHLRDLSCENHSQRHKIYVVDWCASNAYRGPSVSQSWRSILFVRPPHSCMTAILCSSKPQQCALGASRHFECWALPWSLTFQAPCV